MSDPDSKPDVSYASSTEQPLVWPVIPPTAPPKPPRTVRLSHFLVIVIILLVLLTVVGGLAASYSVQLQDYNRLQSQFRDLSAQNMDFQNQIAKLKIQNANPTLTMWNSCGGPCNMIPGNWRVGGVPDTFDYNVSFTSNVPVTVYIVTFSQYVQFANCTGQISCVMGTFTHYGPTTSLPGSVFTLAEGCASYVSIYQTNMTGVIYPNVSLRYNPAPTVTGVC